MALVTYPLNNINYSAEDAELFHCTRTSGVFAADEDFSATVSGTNNIVTIGQGIAWIRNSRFSGKVVANKTSVSIDMGIANGTYDRIDAIVLSFDANKNETTIIKKQGAESSSPVAPTVVRTEALYELHLYHVRRRAGSTSILSSDITDLRADDRYCGIMSDDVTIVGNDFVKKDQIGAENGVAPLGTNSKVPIANLPVSDSTTLNSSNSIATSAAVKAIGDSAPLIVQIYENFSNVSAEDILASYRKRPVIIIDNVDFTPYYFDSVYGRNSFYMFTLKYNGADYLEYHRYLMTDQSVTGVQTRRIHLAIE